MSETLLYWYKSPTVRFAAFQGLLVVVVGLFLGAFMVIATSANLISMVVLLLVALSPFLLIIASKLMGNVQRFLLAVILLEIPIQFDINIGFSEAAADSNILSGFNISITLFCLIFLYICWFAEIVTKRTNVTPVSLVRTSIPLAAYLLVSCLSLLSATVMGMAVFELNLLIQSYLLFLYLIYAVRSRDELFFVLACLVIGLLIQSVIIVALRAVGYTIEFGPISFVVWSGGRIGGTLGPPNSAGSYLTLILVCTLSLTVMPIKAWYKWVASFAFGLGTVALLLTQSRGAWVGFAVAISLFWLVSWRRGWLSLAVPIIVFLCAVPIALYFRGMIIDRLFGDDGGAAESRLPLMLLALRMIRDHWLLGVGANNFAIHLGHYVTPEMTLEWITTVHNKYLLVWAETGIFGLITFVWFLLATVRRGWQVGKVDDRVLAPIGLGFALALVGWMAHMVFDIFHGRTQVQLLLMIAGLIAAIYQISQRTAASDQGISEPSAT
jgi:O-antigen ligase